MGATTSSTSKLFNEIQKDVFLCTLSAVDAAAHPAVKESGRTYRVLTVIAEKSPKKPLTVEKGNAYLCINPTHISPALDDGCVFIESTLRKKSAILLCCQDSVSPAAVLAAAYLCRRGMPLGLACRKLDLEWSGKKGVKPTGTIAWPDNGMLPQLMTAVAVAGGHWLAPSVRTKDGKSRPLKFSDCTTDRVGNDYRNPEVDVKSEWASLLSMPASVPSLPPASALAAAQTLNAAMNTDIAQNTTFQTVKEISVFKTEGFSVFSLNEEGLARGLKKASNQPQIRQPKNAKQIAKAARAKAKAEAKVRAAKAKEAKDADTAKARDDVEAAAQLPEAVALKAKIADVGTRVRQMKNLKQPKEIWLPVVEQMIALRSKYEELTGISLNPKKKKKNKTKGEQPKPQKNKNKKDAKTKSPAASAAAASPQPQENRQKLNAQLAIEKEMQALWEKNNVYYGIPDKKAAGKFMSTFPYPYMNGRLHLGHAFTISKAEFAARFQRLLGKAVLFPFAFHCTGMPIQASANKIRREMELYGNPPVFPKKEVKSRAKLSKKQAAKQGKTVYQWQIMKKLGIKDAEIPAFKDPSHWLEYFPPLGKADLQEFGACVDWRRSFITTSDNPFYNSFIEWQFRQLKAMGLIEFGERPSVFSELDLQICADHDRAEGEGVGPQEYTLIKLKVIAPFPAALNSLAGGSVFLVAATLRPETMYGQTNCFVLPEGDYGAFEMKGDEVFICSKRAARNMYYQGLGKGTTLTGSKLAKSAPKPICLGNFKGTDLIGLAVAAPNATYERVYTLPLMTIKMSKGTGIVTSVPSDAPDDYAALMDMKNKKDFREKFGVTDDMVLPFDVVEIINIPDISSRSAATMCEKMGVISQNDEDKLKEIKDKCYKLGFANGTMLVGKYKGEPVKFAKDKCRADMIAEGTAVAYWEPEDYVQSRSGDECTVAFVDQWFLSYGKPEWRDRVLAHVKNPQTFNTYNPAALKMYVDTLGWLTDWACSRQFGLGTRLPWDSERFVIESLSDSTIYMSYYTVAHILQGNFDGSKLGMYDIKAEHMTDAVWDSIFHGTALPAGNPVPAKAVAEMQKEFNFWYPMDLRVSGKDLIRNHLTMALYNHAAIWNDQPEMWPRSYYANGHVMVDGSKMSKSAGNFLTLDFSVREFSADAARLALADAGDTLDDSNFERATATKALMDLSGELKWIGEQVQDLKDGKLRDSNIVFADKAFDNELNFLISEARDNYEKMLFREATQKAFFNMMSERSRYRVICKSSGIPMHSKFLLRYINAFVVMIAPICPHWCEKVWQKYPAVRLGDKSAVVVNAGWPAGSTDLNPSLRRQYAFVEDYVKRLRKVISKKKKRNVIVYVCEQYADFESEILTFLESKFTDGQGLPNSKDLNQLLVGLASEKHLGKREKKRFMQFANFVAKKEVPAHGRAALATHCPFNQLKLLTTNIAYIKSALNLDSFKVFDASDPAIKNNKDKGKTAAKAAPLKPQCFTF